MMQVGEVLHNTDWLSPVWMHNAVDLVARRILQGKERRYYLNLSKRGRKMFKNATLYYIYDTYVGPYQYRPKDKQS